LIFVQSFTMANSPDLIGATEACQLIGIDRSTLTRWMDRGKIVPAVRLPSPGGRGALLFDRGDIERLRDEYAGSPA
jgi:predicted site-specific integrase-resolvase